MSSYDFDGSSGISPEEAANRLFQWYQEIGEEHLSSRGVRLRMMLFNNECLSALGFHLAVLSYLWPRMKERNYRFYIAFTEEFEADREAMATLFSTTSYLDVPSENIRPIVALIRLGLEEFMQKHAMSYSNFMKRCAKRTFGETDEGAPLN